MKLRALILLLPLLLLVSCGGSSSDNGPPNGGGACMDFSPAQNPASGTVASREGVPSTCDRVAVELIVTDVTDLAVLVNQPNDDQLVLSVTRLGGAAGGVDAVGQQRLLRLFFRRRTDAGTANVAYVQGRLFDAQVAEIPGVSWHGGTLIVR